MGWWRLEGSAWDQPPKMSKNKHSDLEATPMFRDPHVRSASELTLHQTYQPTPLAPPPTKPEADETSQDRDTFIVPSEQNLLDSQPETSLRLSYYSPTDVPSSSPTASSPQPRFPTAEITEKPLTSSPTHLSPTSPHSPGQIPPPSSSSNYSRPSYLSHTTQESFEMQDLSYPPTRTHGSVPASAHPPPSGTGSLAGDGRYRPEEIVAPDASSDDSRLWYGGRAL
ncbi:hypothetical protein EDD16DRAFT_350334 [Pisolithus croceorrhizus]|nr:hypothetical protein EDD16DRAFT_350334 [Pisolithus croceorrhizus]